MILLLLFWEFFKVGLFTFGGGLAMIPLIKDVVISYGWVSESAFYDFIGIFIQSFAGIRLRLQ